MKITTFPNSVTLPPKDAFINLPDATFIAKSNVNIPLPASPAADNIIGTPKGKVASTKNFCSGAVPINLDINKLSSSKLIFCLVKVFVVFKNSLMSKPSVIASATSHRSGLPLGNVSIFTDLTLAFRAKS